LIKIPFIGASYEMDFLEVSAQRCVNMYPEVYTDANAKDHISLRPTHGLLLFTTLAGTQSIRELYLTSTGVLFTVRGKSVSTVNTAGTETARFNLSTGDLPGEASIVRMADNQTQLLIADGTANAYTWNLDTSTATQITDADYPGGLFCGILDGYYIVNKPGTLFAFFSTLDDPTDWPSGNTITKEGTTDPINGLIVSDRRLWLFGRQSYEVHYNTGNSTNQFLRMEGTYHEIGLEAPDSLTQDGENIFWLGASAQGFGKVYMNQGFDAVKISTIPIERAIHGYTTTADAEGLCFQQDGHDFYQLTFPSENKTWVYDKGTGLWHEKLYRNPSTSVDERHRARRQVFFNGNNYFGDWDNGKIYEVSQTTYTDDTQVIIRNRTGPTNWNALERIFYTSFQLDMDVGVGLPTGQGSAPLVMIRWKDKGRWSNKYQMSVGAIGAFGTRVKKNRLGASRARIWEITYSEPTKFSMLNAFVETK